MLHYNPRHVSSINMPIFRRTNCIITASGILTLCAVRRMRADCRAVCSHPAYCTAVYNPRHVSSNNMPIFRKTNFIITASNTVTLCKVQYSMPDDSSLQSSLLSSSILYSCLQRVTTVDTVIIQFVLLKMSMLMLETCRGL